MWNWLGRHKSKKPQPQHQLLAMREADMVFVHPEMDRSHVCSQCGAMVGLYPSGQKILKRYKNVRIVCQVCDPSPPERAPTLEVLAEMTQSVPRDH